MSSGKLSRNALKALAAAAMLLDHMAAAFPEGVGPFFELFRTLGRITCPVMVYLLADGFLYTKDLKKYILRLAIFSLISWFPYCLFETGRVLPRGFGGFSVLTGLLAALLTLAATEKTSWSITVRALSVLALFVLALVSDWSFYPMVWAFGFHRFRGQKPVKWLFFSAFALLYVFGVGLSGGFPFTEGFAAIAFAPIRLGVFLVPALIEFFYNAQRTRSTAFGKWFFYVFYPLHLGILGLIAVLVRP